MGRTSRGGHALVWLGEGSMLLALAPSPLGASVVAQLHILAPYTPHWT